MRISTGFLRPLIFVCSLLAIAFTPQGFTQEEAPTPDIVVVDAQPYKDPRLVKSPTPTFPHSELREGNHGWVDVQMMVDPQGKPYELEVISGSRNEAFEKAALDALKRWRFKPAMLGGNPVDASIVAPVHFYASGGRVIRKEFETHAREALQALQANDRVAADDALYKCDPTNPFEAAHLSIVKYVYARAWGTEDQQREHLRNAIGRQASPFYLSKKSFIDALAALIPLEAKARDYAAVLTAWKALKAQKPEPELLAKLKPLAERVEALRKDPRSYTVNGTMPAGTWRHELFRNKFRIKVTNGHISQIKLYCQTKYVLFLFDATLEYTIDSKYGDCTMIAYGDAGTTLELMQ